jgi:hypothetical protein
MDTANHKYGVYHPRTNHHAMNRPLFKSCPTPPNQGQQRPPRSRLRQLGPTLFAPPNFPWKLSARGSSKGVPIFQRHYFSDTSIQVAMAKGHMKQPHHSIQSTHHHTTPVAKRLPPVLPLFDNIPVYPRPAYGTRLGPNVLADNADKSIANIFCFGAFADRNSNILYHNLTGSFPFMSFYGSVCFLYSTTMNPMPSLHSSSLG